MKPRKRRRMKHDICRKYMYYFDESSPFTKEHFDRLIKYFDKRDRIKDGVIKENVFLPKGGNL